MGSKFIDSLLITGHFVCVLVCFIIMLVATIKIYSSDYQYIQSLGDNWNQGPITLVDPNTNSCPPTEQLLIKDMWPGTVAGCDCSNQLLSFNPLTRGTCSRGNNSSQRYCLNVPAMSPVVYSKWGSKNICGARVPLSYFDLTIAVNDRGCPSSMRSCGIADSLNNVLCIPTATPCPINYIRVVPSGGQVDSNFKYTSLDLDKGKKLIYTNDNVTGPIVVDFKISESTPCINPSYYNTKSSQYLLDVAYGMNTCPAISDGETVETRYSLLDTDSLNEVYTINGVETILSRLPQYKPTNQAYTTGLYTRNYIGLAAFCRADIISANSASFMMSLLLFQSTVEDGLYYVTVAFIISGVLFVLVLFFWSVTVAWNCCKAEAVSKQPLFMIVTQIVIGLLLVIFCAVASSKTSALPTTYQILAEPGCADSITLNIVYAFKNSFGLASNLVYASQALAGVVMVFPVLFIVFGAMQQQN